MGDRVSIQFVNGDDKSVVLFNHWGGTRFPEDALVYAKLLQKEIKTNQNLSHMPLGRLEPETVMVDFIREITKSMDRIGSSLYLGATENDGDNSDNGHYLIDLVNMKLIGGEN